MLEEHKLLDLLKEKQLQSLTILRECATTIQAQWRGYIERVRHQKRMMDKKERDRVAREEALESEEKQKMLKAIERRKRIEASWAEVEDPNTGILRWVNSYTEEISWNKPLCVKQREEEEAKAWQAPTTTEYPWSILCSECEDDVAKVVCETCDQPYCIECLAESHKIGSTAKHYMQMIDLDAMNAEEGTIALCNICDVQKAVTKCTVCEDDYCLACFQRQHSKGRKAGHISEDVKQPKVVSKRSLFILNKKQEEKETLPCCVNIATKRGWNTYKRLTEDEAERERIKKRREEKREANRPMLQAAFDMFDLDGSGSLSPQEIKVMLHTTLLEPVTESELADAIKHMDKNGDGEISFEEFLDWYILYIYLCASRLDF